MRLFSVAEEEWLTGVEAVAWWSSVAGRTVRSDVSVLAYVADACTLAMAREASSRGQVPCRTECDRERRVSLQGEWLRVRREVT